MEPPLKVILEFKNEYVVISNGTVLNKLVPTQLLAWIMHSCTLWRNWFTKPIVFSNMLSIIVCWDLARQLPQSNISRPIDRRLFVDFQRRFLQLVDSGVSWYCFYSNIKPRDESVENLLSYLGVDIDAVTLQSIRILLAFCRFRLSWSPSPTCMPSSPGYIHHTSGRYPLWPWLPTRNLGTLSEMASIQSCSTS